MGFPRNTGKRIINFPASGKSCFPRSRVLPWVRNIFRRHGLHPSPPRVSPYPIQKRPSHAGEPFCAENLRYDSQFRHNSQSKYDSQFRYGSRFSGSIGIPVSKTVIPAIPLGIASPRHGQGQAGTFGEGPLADRCNTIRDRDRCKGFAAEERSITDGGNTIRQADRGEIIGAAHERPVADDADGMTVRLGMDGHFLFCAGLIGDAGGSVGVILIFIITAHTGAGKNLRRGRGSGCFRFKRPKGGCDQKQRRRFTNKLIITHRSTLLALLIWLFLTIHSPYQNT